MARPKAYDDDLRRQLLETAGRLLREEGPHALTTRRVAAEVGTSTTAIYSLIGAKQDLVREVYLEGFRRLAEHLDSIAPTDDPLLRLRELGAAYLDNALENPHLYTVMFSSPIAEFNPTPEDYAFTVTTLQTLIDCVQAIVDAGLMQGDVNDIATGLWAVSHGVATLAINGLFDEEQARRVADELGGAALRGLMGTAASDERASLTRP